MELLFVVHGLHVTEALGHVGVGHVDLALHAVEQGRRHAEKTCGCILIRHGADMPCHAEYFLYDDHAAARLARGLGQVC